MLDHRRIEVLFTLDGRDKICEMTCHYHKGSTLIIGCQPAIWMRVLCATPKAPSGTARNQLRRTQELNSPAPLAFPLFATKLISGRYYRIKHVNMHSTSQRQRHL